MWPVGGVSDCHEIEESKFVVVAGGKEAERERERESFSKDKYVD
jgi:hypothetical protein